MYNVKNTSFKNKAIRHENVYVASKTDSSEDEYGNIIPQYLKPIKYSFNVMPLTESSDIQAFGENVNATKVVVLDYNLYKNKFKAFDVAYLDGVTPDGETIHGENANYKIANIRPQNQIIKIYFQKIVKGE